MNANELFTYIVVMIVVGFILIFGLRAIGAFQGNTADIGVESYREDFRLEVQRISQDHGSVRFFSVRGIAGYTQTCVIDLQRYDPSCTTIDGIDQRICDLWKDLAETPQLERQNIILVGQGIPLLTSHAPQLVVPNSEPEGVICKRAGDEFRLEGFQRTTRVS